MSSDEDSDQEIVASDEEEEGIINPIPDTDSETEVENEFDEEEVHAALAEMSWTRNSKERRGRKRQKDVLKSEAKLLFDSSDIKGCFDNFITNEIKELLVKYTNLKGEK